jgi:hypothetical protein
MFTSVREAEEVRGHCANIVRNQNSLLFRRQRQDLGISHAPQSRSMCGQKI